MNVLVTDRLHCCLTDLGLAVSCCNQGLSVDRPHILPYGSRRYMPPEVICSTMDTLSFSAYKQADMYSLCLVLYEILITTKGN